MCEDVILDVTADFIRGSKTNLKLALQVERAMPFVREHFVKATLHAVEERFPRTEWTIDRSGVQDVMAKGASLALRHEGWTTNHGDAAHLAGHEFGGLGGCLDRPVFCRTILARDALHRADGGTSGRQRVFIRRYGG